MKQNPLINEVSSITAELYAVADDIERYDADEKWRTCNKLKNAANDAYFYVAQSVGAGEAQSYEYDTMSAQKNLTAARSMYIFATKQGMIELEPELIIRIDKVIKAIEAEHAASQVAIKAKADDDMKPWLEKYKIWQKISKD